ncbi:MAG: hypothetical protein GF333_01710 [Candidatus Omnitrophica bacterium]|nr:hypothetical protein [Candidatus Omnitrophota bacterium]
MRRNGSEIFFEGVIWFLIFFPPLFSGGLPFLPRVILFTVIFSLVPLVLLRAAVRSEWSVCFPREIWILGGFFAVLVFQLIPLPEGMLGFFSPATAAIYRTYAAEVSPRVFSISIYPYVTLLELVYWAGYAGLFLVAVNLFNTRRRMMRVVYVMILWAFVLGAYGVIEKYILGWSAGRLTFSTFGNKNHFAGYMVLISPLAFSFAFYEKDRAKKLVLGFLGGLLSLMVFLSFSRAGTIALLGALGFMGLLVWQQSKTAKAVGGVVAAVLLVAGLLSLAGIDQFIQRFSSLPSGLYTRTMLFQDALEIIGDFPLFGTGEGTFRYIYPMYKDIITTRFTYHLLNDHLELLLETGLAGACAYFGFLSAVFVRIVRKLSERKDPFAKYLVIGGLSGTAGLLFHSFFEFNFFVPAVACMFWLILGITYKGVHTRFARQ